VIRKFISVFALTLVVGGALCVMAARARYHVDIPSGWRPVDMGPGAPFDQYYEASGTFLPVSFNGGPVIVNAWVMAAEGTDLDEAKRFIVEGYSQNPDRVFPKGFSHEEEKIKLKSGEDAYIINTRFFRTDKQLNQSRFDLIAFPKKGKGYTYTITVQYPDSSYEFENKYELKKHAKDFYSSFSFR
jgi:hypothetical protein